MRIALLSGGGYATLLALTCSLSACMSMSGLSGKSEYACQAPDGVACDSVAGTYANAVHHNLPSQRKSAAAPQTPTARSPAATASIATGPAFTPINTPLRSQSRVLRLWFKPWEDADHDLYDQGYVYVQVDSGQWQIDHAQRAIREAYAPLRPPPAAVASPREPETLPREPVPYPSITLPSEDPR